MLQVKKQSLPAAVLPEEVIAERFAESRGAKRHAAEKANKNEREKEKVKQKE